MAQEKKYKTLLSNTATVAIGTLGSKLLVYLLVRLYTSVLSGEEYSIASNITELATLLIPFISLGIGEAVFRFTMDKTKDSREIFTLGFVAIGLGALLLPPLAALLLSIDYFKNYVWLLYLYVIASAIHTNCSQFIRAKAMFRLYAAQGLFNTLLTITFNILFLIPLQMGVVGYVLSVALADLLSSALIIIAARLHRYVSFRSIRKSTLKAMLLYSLPLIPTTVSWWITNVSDRYMITYMKGDAINGLYAAAYKIPSLLMVLIGIFNSAWKYSAVEEKDQADATAFFSQVYRSFVTVLFCIAGGIIAFSRLLSLLMFGKDFREAWVYIPILTLAMTFSALSSFTGTVFIVEKKSSYSLYTSLGAAAINILLNLLLIPLFTTERFGAMGAAIATLAAYIVMFVLRLWLSVRLTHYRPYLTVTLLNTVTVGAMALVATAELSYTAVIEAGLLVILLAINYRGILSTLRTFLARNKRSPKTEE
ncbi:MAG: polysaccharide biosynthesis C-terminal domain-containing protein [Clostridia bacterium]|nr:polysaccharide biosynthesis C-terminal domain-containing protein [Clostridia bacterium]